MLRANFIKKECKNMYRLGIDLGGTNIVAGVVNKEYKIISKASSRQKLRCRAPKAKFATAWLRSR